MKINILYEKAPVKEATITFSLEEIHKLHGILSLASTGCRSKGRFYSDRYDTKAEEEIFDFKMRLKEAGL